MLAWAQAYIPGLVPGGGSSKFAGTPTPPSQASYETFLGQRFLSESIEVKSAIKVNVEYYTTQNEADTAN